jgi:4-hydroxy-tetrahydrodipicolinate synthase
MAGTLALVRVAESEGVAGLLLPMPSFFPYQQEDLQAYCRDVAAATSLPILLYNLPQFTSGLQPETVRRLIEDVPNIVGIKDSSGSLEILRALTAHGIDACRIVGNDSALAPALAEGVCDGVVSGVACALPELIVELYAQRTCQNSPRFEELLDLLTAYIGQLDQFPTPWGLKWTLEARGLIQASFSQPVTAHRREQAAALMQWARTHVPAVLPAIELP